MILIRLAVYLTGIALRGTQCGLLLTPSCGRNAESAFERVSKGFRRTESHRQRQLQHRDPGLGHQPRRRDLASSAPQVVPHCFAHPRREQTMEVIWRKMRDRSQGIQVEGPIKMPVDVLGNTLHSIRIHGAALGRTHAASSFMTGPSSKNSTTPVSNEYSAPTTMRPEFRIKFSMMSDPCRRCVTDARMLARTAAWSSASRSCLRSVANRPSTAGRIKSTMECKLRD